MANQMIALQARNPQLPDPSRAAAQYANMMNMASQQRASQLQGERIRQEMEFAKAKEGREVDTQAATMREKDLDIEDKELARLYKIGAAILETEDPTAREAGYQNLLGLIDQTSPQLGATMRQVAGTFNPQVLQSVMMETEQYFNKKYATPIAVSAVNDRTGQQSSLTLGGTDPRAEVVGEVAPRSTPTAPPRAAAAPQTLTGQVRTGKFGETLVVPDSARPLTADQQDHIRRMQEELGMTNTPASFSPGASAGQMTPDMVPAILDSAVNTGVMAQIDLDQMLALAPPQARQGIMDVIRNNKINLQADAPSLAASGMGQQQMAPNPVQRPQAQFADMRGPAPQASFANLGGQPAMQNTMLQSQGRTPFIPRRESPTPAEVSPERLRAEATAKRQTPAEAAAITAAIENTKVGIQRDARIAEETRTSTKGRKLFSKALNDMRSDYQTLNKLRAIPSTERPMLDNFGDAISSSFIGRKVQSAAGSKASVALNNIANSRLTLLNALKEVTGMSAAQLSSNVELMTFLDSLADPTQGYESAMETIRRLENLYGAPASAPAKRQTPTKSSSGWGTAKVVGN